MNDAGAPGRILRISGGMIVDPVAGTESLGDVLVADGKIAGLEVEGSTPAEEFAGAEVIDARGLLVLPGAVDMRVHLREPGFEYKESIESGTRAAVAGGVTSVACMPNTKPVNDNAAVTRYILERARMAAAARVFPIGAVSVGLEGENLAEFAGMHEAGIVAVSDGGRVVADAELMRRALECVKLFDIPVIDHAEDASLAAGGLMHEGAVSLRLGLRGIPAEAEEVVVARDIALAQLTGGRLHIGHLSAAGSVRRIRAARAAGIRVTAEASPHHLWLNDEAVGAYETNAKVSPPLRGEADREALLEGLGDGTIDVIASDHAPHHRDEKDVEFESAKSGVVGLETLLPLTLRLVREGVMDRATAISKVTSQPAEILGLGLGLMEVGREADLALVDPEARWVVGGEEFLSKGRNTPFEGLELVGRTVMTIVRGNVVYELDSEQSSGAARRRSA